MFKIYVIFIILALFAYGWWYFTPHYSPKVLVSPKVISGMNYLCNENKTIQAIFYEGEEIKTKPGEMPIPTGSMNITLDDGRALMLKQSISASGVRYANEDESFVFWNKGYNALILEDNQEKQYMGCVAIAPKPENKNLSRMYKNNTYGFSIWIPENYIIDETYTQELSSKQKIEGVKFTIPKVIERVTNLSDDTSIIVEKNLDTPTCIADVFLENTTDGTQNITEENMIYSVAKSSDAAAGNRYEEIVYAIPGSSPCIGIRYFIHYGVFENFPEGTIQEFDKQALINEFDSIRKTLIQI